MLTRRDYENALLSQSACNLSGIVHSLEEVLGRVWEEVTANGGGTDQVNTHPIVRLYAEQIHFLAARSRWQSAYDECKQRAEGE